MPGLEDLNVLGFIISAWCFHFTRQLMARLIKGREVDVFSTDEGGGLELMERRFPLRTLLSKKLGVCYLVNRLAAIVAIDFFVWSLRWIVQKWAHS